MELGAVFIMIMIGALILLIACAVKGEMENILSFTLRGLLGAWGIYLTNFCLAPLGVSLCVGINFYTFLTTAILGLPGFLGLYALGIYHRYV